MDILGYTLHFSDANIQKISPNSALVFVDETGDEQTSDPQYPIFGLGGCAVLAKDYYELIEKPWTEIKCSNFCGQEGALHAADLRNLTKIQIDAFNKFFTTKLFGRFAVLATHKTLVDPKLNLVQSMFFSFYNRILEILKWTQFSNIVIIYEDSKRLIPKLELCSANTQMEEHDIDIEIISGKMDKKIGFSGLEVADFIIHSAGTTLRDQLYHRITKLEERPDFKNIFSSIDEKYTSYMKIDKVIFNEKTI